jgi:hypothetical protein
MKFQAPPPKKNETGLLTVEKPAHPNAVEAGIPEVNGKKAVDEKAILTVIKKGGSPALSGSSEQPQLSDEVPIRNINLVLLATEVDEINRIRKRYPKKAGKKIAISQKEWIAIAVREKLEKDRKIFPA